MGDREPLTTRRTRCRACAALNPPIGRQATRSNEADRCTLIRLTDSRFIARREFHSGRGFGARCLSKRSRVTASAILDIVRSVVHQPFPTIGGARGQIWRHEPSTRRPRHFHADPELNLIAAGSASFGVGEQVLGVGANDLLWWAPGQDHELLDASDDFELYVIGLSPAFSERVLGPAGVNIYRGPQVLRLSAEQLAMLSPYCQPHSFHQDTIAAEHRVGDFWQSAHAMRLGALSYSHPLTQRAIRYALQRTDMNRKQIADAACSSSCEVSRHFRRDMGITLTTYRTRLRLLRFMQLVDSRKLGLCAASLEAGFGCYSQCHRAFHQTLGCSPRTYFNKSLRQAVESAFEPFLLVDPGSESRAAR
jgi:AraC-like DNA-binding protein